MADRTITVEAVGKAQAPPDEVALQFAARAVEPDVTSARRAVAEQSTRLRTVLGDVGVSDANVKTKRFHVRRRPPNRDPQSEADPEEQPYEATEHVGVTIHDLDSLGEVLAVAVDDAGAEIDGVTFTFRTETKRELDREAIEDAVETARKKAAAAAAAERLAVGDVRSMTTDDASNARQSGVGLGHQAATESGRAPQSGPIDVTANAEVTYELRQE